MHYRLEVVMPPTEDLETDLRAVLEEFGRNGEDEDGEDNRHGFWDFYVIGGRFAGAKLLELLAGEKFDEFRAELQNMDLTVSGVQFGKPSLEPACQAEKVDSMWNKFFPDLAIKSCPLFAHSNDQYKNSSRYPDVMLLSDVPDNCTSERVLVAGPRWGNPGKREAKYMLQRYFWNGANYQKTAWDGTLKSALEKYSKRLDRMNPEHAAKIRPQPDWLVVTVDYHS
jgi:hypothetical protein